MSYTTFKKLRLIGRNINRTRKNFYRLYKITKDGSANMTHKQDVNDTNIKVEKRKSI